MSNNPVWVLFDGVVTGLLYAGLIVFVGSMEPGPVADDLYLRAFFGFVLGICSKPAIDGARIELISEQSPRFGRYCFGWAMGSTWGLAMILAAWPLNPLQLALWLAAAVFFGTFLALSYKPTEVQPTRANLYDVSKNIYEGWNPLWRIFPGLFLVGTLAVVLVLNADERQEPPYLLFGLAAALMNSNFPYRVRHRGLLALQMSGVIAIIVAYLSL